MLACSCSNPACMVNGCMIANRLRQQHAQPPYGPNPSPLPVGARPLVPLTEADVRRIIREEIKAALSTKGSTMGEMEGKP